ncbi:MAG: adenine deaminase [Negativicutes bacterium]|nr:adenine deaminase [Negativicutes bacterium]
MFNCFATKPLDQLTQLLSAVAMGAQAADLVIRNAKLINVHTAEILPQTDIAIAAGRIALVGDARHCIGAATKIIDAAGCYVAPGFLDGHIHVESSMLTVGEFAKAVVPHGTTGIYMDPHEICNVLGAEGVRYMMEDAQNTPLKTMTTMPSCVPSVPGFEDTGAAIDAQDIKESMTWPGIVGLGEMMNYPGILASAAEPHAELAETYRAGKIATGHYAIPETGKGLNAFIAAGIRCCHESTRAEEALAKMRLGMYAMIREGSAWQDLKATIKAITEHKVDTRMAVLVTDDAHPHTLVTEGHVDRLLRRAIEEGVDPLTAIQMVTINCAQCFRMDAEIGSIAPSKAADLVFFHDLQKIDVFRVIIDGIPVAENGVMLQERKNYTYPAAATHSMQIKQQITAASFGIPCDRLQALVRVIEVHAAQIGTTGKEVTMQSHNGLLEADCRRDLLKAAVFERHHATGKVGYGFVQGFQIKKGAMASTVAHDAHNLLVIGTNDQDMALAANTLIQSNGGMVVVADGKVLGLVALPIAGLMNDLSAAAMSKQVAALAAAWREIGCNLASPFMTMAMISLPCIPELRLTDRGLVDCNQFEFVTLIVQA